MFAWQIINSTHKTSKIIQKMKKKKKNANINDNLTCKAIQKSKLMFIFSIFMPHALLTFFKFSCKSKLLTDCNKKFE